MGTCHGNPNQLFYAPAHVYVLWPKGRLVHLLVEHSRSILHFLVRHLPRIGAARDKLGTLVAQLYSVVPRMGCTTRHRAAARGGGRHCYFHLAYHFTYFARQPITEATIDDRIASRILGFGRAQENGNLNPHSPDWPPEFL
jgi:hypothetical protein